MFTGLIQSVGQIKALEARGGDLRLTIDCGELDLSAVTEGDSIAVSGVCLAGGGSGTTPSCVESCQTSDDCIHAGQVFSADNYECAGGKCKWLGCDSDDECLNTFGAVSDVCL
mgnify:CR=1 FL=1